MQRSFVTIIGENGGITIPTGYLKEVGLSQDDEVGIEVIDQTLIICRFDPVSVFKEVAASSSSNILMNEIKEELTSNRW
jgi:antitoxin component of MazEF toxin-antitoxin module